MADNDDDGKQTGGKDSGDEDDDWRKWLGGQFGFHPPDDGLPIPTKVESILVTNVFNNEALRRVSLTGIFDPVEAKAARTAIDVMVDPLKPVAEKFEMAYKNRLVTYKCVAAVTKHVAYVDVIVPDIDIGGKK